MTADITSHPHVAPEHLCIGLYVCLDLSWTEHPFTFSSFRIKSQEQIATLRGLGLARIRYNPDKSDCLPPAPLAGAPAAPSEAALTAASAAAAAGHERKRKLAQQRAKAHACQKELVSAAQTVRDIGQNVFARPREIREAAEGLVQRMASSMLVDADVSIQLMTDKAGGEEVYFHALNVALLSMMLAKELRAPAEVVHTTGLGALFHDLGELEIPDRIVRQLAPLNRSETALLQMHCQYGVNLAGKMALPADVQQVIAQHHEKVDGSGYPQGVTAAQMSLPARIVSLVNAYDELCNPPNPAQALTPHEALSCMFAQQRSQYDALALGAFVRCMGVYPPGTIVVLSNGAIAMVVSVNTAKPLRPVVLVFDPELRKEEALLLDLEADPGLSIKLTMRPQQLSEAAYAYLAPRRRTTYYFDTDACGAGSSA